MMRSLVGIKDIVDRMRREDAQRLALARLEDAERLARIYAEVDGYELPANELVRDGRTPRARRYWLMACASYSFIAGTDLVSAIDEASSA